jgi:SET domain-containing protein
VNISNTTYICFFAKKDIKAGEELLFNYGNDYQLDWTKIDNNVTRLLNAVSLTKYKKIVRKKPKKI